MVQTKPAALTGNEAMAEAMRQINPDVVAAYPITPQTEIVQIFADFAANGKVKTQFVQVESEHSALSAVVGAAASGARAMTATSSNGLAYMWEILYIASSLRLPVVMPVINRTLSGNINIHCDHSDTMGARDAGWIQIYCEDAQEAYDSMIMAVRIAERARLPVMVMTDGFIISHCMTDMALYPDEAVRAFVGEFKPRYSLFDLDHPISVGPIDLPDWYMEHKEQQSLAMGASKPIVLEAQKAFAQDFGRKDYGLFDAYRLDDAEYAMVVIGSTAGTARPVVDALRAQGRKVGLLRPRLFRPFPAADWANALSGKKGIVAMDRSDSLADFGGPVAQHLRAALYDAPFRPPMMNLIYGLGGREIQPEEIRQIFENLFRHVETGASPRSTSGYWGVREWPVKE
ncbi:MAG: pyruvate ferredoxin oxidoreductase [Planctomycetota bacterium]